MDQKVLRKTIRILDKCEDLFLLVVCMLLFFIGLYALIDSYLVYQHANDSSILKYKPGYEGELPDRPIVGNMAAWLTIEDTNIDYPVTQGDTNEEYLNKDPYGDYSLSGSIFLDSRNAADFSDDYSLIYGHHMEGAYMFGSLHSFLEKDFFNAHRHGELIVGQTAYTIDFFAVMDTEATQEYVFAPTEYETEDVLDYIKDHAGIYDESVLEQGEGEKRLLGLSTCKYPDSVYRVVLFGILTNPHQILTGK